MQLRAVEEPVLSFVGIDDERQSFHGLGGLEVNSVLLYVAHLPCSIPAANSAACLADSRSVVKTLFRAARSTPANKGKVTPEAFRFLSTIVSVWFGRASEQWLC